MSIKEADSSTIGLRLRFHFCWSNSINKRIHKGNKLCLKDAASLHCSTTYNSKAVEITCVYHLMNEIEMMSFTHHIDNVFSYKNAASDNMDKTGNHVQWCKKKNQESHDLTHLCDWKNWPHRHSKQNCGIQKL